MKYKIGFILILSTFITLALCSIDRTADEDALIKFNGQAQGTFYSITYYDSLARNFKPEIDSLLELIDQSVSIYDENSSVSAFNKGEDYAMDVIFSDNLRLSREVFRKTNGAFDITIGPIAEAWGWGFSKRDSISEDLIDTLLQYVGLNKVLDGINKPLKMYPQTTINFNAIAQGYAVDYVGAFLEKQGIKSFLIDIGGEVLAKGTKPDGAKWIIGIDKPSEKDPMVEREMQATIEITDKAIATSGSYRKFYVGEDGVKYSHTLDPKTGYPVTHSLLSATVVTDTCALADAWATAFMVVGLDSAKVLLNENKNLEAYFIYSDEEGNIQTFITEALKEFLQETAE